MRRNLGALVFTALMGIVAAPLAATGNPAGPETPEPTASQAPVAVQRVAVPATGIRDEAAMVIVGTMLIGLAAAVRRSA